MARTQTQSQLVTAAHAGRKMFNLKCFREMVSLPSVEATGQVGSPWSRRALMLMRVQNSELYSSMGNNSNLFNLRSQVLFFSLKHVMFRTDDYVD